MHYQYDGSFLGFLSVIYQAYHDGTSHVEKIENLSAGPTLFGNEKNISLNTAHSEKVLKSLYQQCGARATHILYYAFMAEQPEREMILFYYICCAFRYKKTFAQQKYDPWIQQVEHWSLKTSNERHRMLGLIRFNELEEGMMYANIHPDYNIVPLLAGHFTNRMPNERWAIHDLHRHIAAYYDKQNVVIADVTEPERNIKYSQNEEEFRSIWYRYYCHIAIKERTNPALQRSFMPKKYWPYLTEMNYSKQKTL
ncbi:TIGR03915 family putative DNA repair protein [Pectinatus sottacetonis]|uniref:TIGR03915 family putative DNA repair protein n=1 Tax=Pectinatus sottacetonis TaxID=1002795 RepID=UPI0018C4CBDB|nr:TIGR03915 family putative DNA repair protein [Pectinatus sottacetonis]